MKAKPSMQPQRINSNLWYYENKASITLVIDVPKLHREAWSLAPVEMHIPKNRLVKSLRRMGVRILPRSGGPGTRGAKVGA